MLYSKKIKYVGQNLIKWRPPQDFIMWCTSDDKLFNIIVTWKDEKILKSEYFLLYTLWVQVVTSDDVIIIILVSVVSWLLNCLLY